MYSLGAGWRAVIKRIQPELWNFWLNLHLTKAVTASTVLELEDQSSCKRFPLLPETPENPKPIA